MTKRTRSPWCHYPPYFRLDCGPVVSSTGSYIICINRNTSFVVKEQGILLQFWNSVGRMKLTGGGFRYSGNVTEFSGNFHKTDILSGAEPIKIKRKWGVIWKESLFSRGDLTINVSQNRRVIFVFDILEQITYFWRPQLLTRLQGIKEIKTKQIIATVLTNPSSSSQKA